MGDKEIFYLENIYREYQKSPDDFSLEHVLVAMEKFNPKKKVIESGDFSSIYPVIRSYKDKDYYGEKITHDLSLNYILDYPTHVQFIDNTQVNPKIEKKIKMSAFENLFKQGWVVHENEEENAAGKMLVFKELDKNYQAQFLMKGMFQKYLGDQFYIILPSKHLSIVLIPKGDEESVLEGMLKLKEFAVKLYAKESYPISEKLYYVKNGEFNFMG
jgi:hypothetical protein